MFLGNSGECVYLKCVYIAQILLNPRMCKGHKELCVISRAEDIYNDIELA